MSNKTFIASKARQLRSGENVHGINASLFADGNAVYSYGYHYPLLYRIEKPDGTILLICNKAGYSPTTSKHIGHCALHADLWVKLPRGTSVSYEGFNRTVAALIQEQRDIVEEMQKQKRQNTWVYKDLQSQLTTVGEYLRALTV